MYHEGELRVQQQAGVAAEAARVGRIIGSSIPPAAARFIEGQVLLVTSTIDGDGRVWASPLRGAVRVIDERTMHISPVGGQTLSPVGLIGILAIDMATRRRMRVNGRVTRDGNDLVVTTDEVYSNCPQYIHPLPARPDTSSPERWVATSDTFFLASAHTNGGADASHRGGEPGFVTFDGTRVVFPDYRGNNMFNSLGNLEVNPNCGLLFLDFESGAALQLTGRGRVMWDGARRVEIDIDAVRLSPPSC